MVRSVPPRLSDGQSSSSTATPPWPSFQSRVSAVKPPKTDINALILDYLTMEGYTKAAANFSREANLKPQQDSSFVTTRQKIVSAIHTGNIEEAITSLNHFNPEILDQDPTLHFALLRLQLVELIRESTRMGADYKPIIKFAQDHLATFASTSLEFRTQLEETMVMLFFVPEKMPPAQIKLLSPNLRREVAEKVNKAMLYHHCKRREAAIRQLVKMRAWAEEKVRDRSPEALPAVLDLGLQAHGREHDEMVTN